MKGTEVGRRHAGTHQTVVFGLRNCYIAEQIMSKLELISGSVLAKFSILTTRLSDREWLLTNWALFFSC